MESSLPTCPDGIPGMPKKLIWKWGCLDFSGPNIILKLAISPDC